MRIFVTGASGFVGSAVVQDLIAHGHSVTGLARSEAGRDKLKALGADVLMGALEDVETLRHAAAGADGVAHLGFIHDFSKFLDNCAIDKAAIAAMGEALAGSGRPLVVTSGIGLMASGETVTEDTLPPENSGIPRVSEQTAMTFLDRGVKAMAVRLPIVHGANDHGFVPLLIGMAREKGFAAHVGRWANAWPAVDRVDAARVYRLALEKGTAGRRYHPVAEAGVALQAIAEVIGKRLHLPVVDLTPEAAEGYFGWFTPFAGMNTRASSLITQAELGWQPIGPTMIEVLDSEAYFPG
ncbi:MAG: SDR family oxidoreductase [Ancalomicrobiaceae bacterium]|nr:SDR family oxidoreductase [Ancalomicrobiaceae bacterium]